MGRLKPRRTSRHRGGQVGAATTQLEGHAAGLGWPGDIWWALPEVCGASLEAGIHHPALRAVERAPGPSSNVWWTISSDPQVERHAAELPIPLCCGPTATSTKLAGVYNSGSMKTWGQSHGSGAWLSVGLMPFIHNICDFCPGSYFLNPDCHSDLPQMWCNFCI